MCAAILWMIVPLQMLFAENDGSRYAKNSVLSSGKWIRIKVTENAVYKLTYDDLKKNGINDPSKVKIYGYGAWILDEDFSKLYVDDLPEVSVYINKGSDGVFNSGDYLLFYGRGMQKWTYNKTRDAFEHENNPYSTAACYFLTESETGGPKEMETIPSASGTATTTATTLTIFDDYFLHERDSLTISHTGRELFGETFVNKPSDQHFYFTIPGVTSDPGKMRLSFAGAPKVVDNVRLTIGETQLALQIQPPLGANQKARLVDGWKIWTGEKPEQITATVSYNAAGQIYANLNFIALNVKRALRFYNTGYTFFRNKESLSNPVLYSIDNASSSCLVWDVTGNFDTRLVQTTTEGASLRFSTVSDNTTLHEYAMVDLSKTFPAPVFAGEVKNQDLHALPQTDMVILAPEVFLPYAEKLAEKHRSHSGLKVTVVNDKSVFNEFSSGSPDATAYRRFMKMFYDRAASETDKPRYLLLFGDGVFDNRHLTPEIAKMDTKYYLLTFQVKESLDEAASFGTDDYFGFLDDREGSNIVSDAIDLGIGRFPVSSLLQAENAVNKVMAYMDNTQYGNWKNKIIFTADNTDVYSPANYCEHATQADLLARYMDDNHPEYTLSKYYMDAYKSESVNGKTTFPEAKKAFLNDLKEGCFLLNYTGHGSTSAWSSEDMLQISDVRQMNFEHLPLWITATCDFGWFDGTTISGGEEAFLNKKGGAIALFTTSRVVYSVNNSLINQQLMRHLFEKENGGHLRLGDVLRKSKVNLSNDSNKLNYVLLGDPALELNYPDMQVRLEAINGKPVESGEEFVFKALDKVALSGTIVDAAGKVVEDFSGSLNTNVFDSKQTIRSINTNTAGNYFSFTNYPFKVYSGDNEVKNGRFELTFTVPLDISYTDDFGKMNFYAAAPQQGRDASGSFLRYKLTGTSDNPGGNEAAPQIVQLFLNNENFKDGDNVNETPYFFALVYDEDGINRTGSGLGHDILISIDGNPAWTYVLNNHYTAESDTEGTIGFSIPELPSGRHTLLFRVWDILNNPAVDSLHFNVVNGYKPEIFDLQAQGNPARTNTYFVLTHSLPETQLNVEIRVYDLTGRAVWSHIERGSSAFLKSYPIEWNLANNAGNRVQSGIYIYRAVVSTSSSKEATKAKKIIVLGQ
ncbi:MAG: type IX secretion system sortase PorU [Candidatus Symbiothrix sp.]|jgi:hypothetical protein|nr:type IX secretion system sortase PorU [Candidatus Symbiothrix sp.]